MRSQQRLFGLPHLSKSNWRADCMPSHCCSSQLQFCVVTLSVRKIPVAPILANMDRLLAQNPAFDFGWSALEACHFQACMVIVIHGRAGLGHRMFSLGYGFNVMGGIVTSNGHPQCQETKYACLQRLKLPTQNFFAIESFNALWMNVVWMGCSCSY